MLRFACLFLVVDLFVWGAPPRAENIDPAGSDARYAWGENVGWFNAQPLGPGGPGLQIDDFELTGWLYGENVGWVSLSCKNTASCDRVRYGVRHDGAGNLFGQAWAENLGWVDFRPAIGGAPVAGVTIDLYSGEFDGAAWLENVGWLIFTLESSGVSPIRTAWTCEPGAPDPMMAPVLQLGPNGDDTLLMISGAGDATGHDIVAGDLGLLRVTGGDYRSATNACVADDSAFDSDPYLSDPALGEGIWFIARGVTCSGSGSYDVPAGAGGVTFQAASRDAGINAAASSCP